MEPKHKYPSMPESISPTAVVTASSSSLSPHHWIILLAHGSRDEQWHAPIRHLRKRIEESTEEGGPHVAIAYLQYCAPTLQDILEQCRTQDGRFANIIPIFLSSGGHVIRDVAQSVANLSKQYPEVSIRLYGAIGEEPEVLEGMAKACIRMCFNGYQ